MKIEQGNSPNRYLVIFSIALLLLLAGLAFFGSSWSVAHGQTVPVPPTGVSPAPLPSPSVDDPLALVVVADSYRAAPGQVVKVTFSLTNLSGEEATTIMLTSEGSVRFMVTEAAASKGTLTRQGNTVSLSLPSLAADEKVILTISARVNPTGKTVISNYGASYTGTVGGKTQTRRTSVPVSINPSAITGTNGPDIFEIIIWGLVAAALLFLMLLVGLVFWKIRVVMEPPR